MAAIVNAQFPTATVTPTGTAINGNYYSNASSPTFNVAFNAAVTGLSPSGFTVTNGTVGTVGTVSGSGASYTVSVTPSGQGAVSLQVNAGAAQNASFPAQSNTLSNTASITYDTVAPTVSSLKVEPSMTSVAPTINASFADNNFIVGAEYFIDTLGSAGGGTSLQITPNGATATATMVLPNFATLPDGIHTIYVDAVDAAGNWSPTLAAAFTKDTTAPTVTSVTVTPIPSIATPTIHASISDNISVAKAEYFVGTPGTPGQGTPLTLTPNGATAIATGVISPSGNPYTFYVDAQDAAGNWSAPVEGTIVNGQYPTATVTPTGTAAYGIYYSNAPSLTFNVAFNVAVTGLSPSGFTVTNGTVGTVSGSGASYTVSVTPSGQGAVTLQANAGAAQNASFPAQSNTLSNTASITYDTVAPTVSSLTATTNYYMNAGKSLYFWLYFSESVVIAPGTKIALNSGGTAAVPVTPGSSVLCGPYTAVAGQNVSHLDFASGNILIAGSITDYAGNPVSWPTVPSSVWAGNNIVVDTTPPTPTVTPSGTATNQKPITFAITFSEAMNSFLSTSNLTVTNGTIGTLAHSSPTNYTVQVTPSAQGPVTLQVNAGSAYDMASNYNIASNIASVIYDTTAPATTASLAGTLGNNNWYTSNVTITLNASDSLSGVASTSYTIDNGSSQPYGTPFVVSGDGTHTVTYSSTDKAGNIETVHTVTIKIDATAPSINASAKNADNSPYTAGVWTNQDVTVHFTASDATSGLASVAADLTVSAEGETDSVSGTAIDNAGNQAPVTFKPILIDKTAPTATILSGPASLTSSTSATFNYSATDPTPNGVNSVSGVNYTQYSLDSTSWVAATSPLTLTGLTDGGHTLAVRAVDNAGNIGPASTAYAWTVDTSAPTWCLQRPASQPA